MIGSIPGGLLGTKLSTHVPSHWLKRILCGVLFITGTQLGGQPAGYGGYPQQYPQQGYDPNSGYYDPNQYPQQQQGYDPNYGYYDPNQQQYPPHRRLPWRLIRARHAEHMLADIG